MDNCDVWVGGSLNAERHGGGVDGWMNGQMGGERVREGEMDGFKWMQIEKYEMVGLLPIRIVKSNVLSVGPLSERNNISNEWMSK